MALPREDVAQPVLNDRNIEHKVAAPEARPEFGSGIAPVNQTQFDSSKAAFAAMQGRVGGNDSAMEMIRGFNLFGNGAAGAAAEQGVTKLDKKQSPEQLAASGTIKDKSQDGGDAGIERRPATDKSAQRVTIEMQDLQKPSEQKPHFTIKQNGQIEMNGDPEKLNSKNIKVALERQPGQLNPTPEQQKAADALAGYLSDRLKDRSPRNRRSGVELDDRDDVVNDRVERKHGMRHSQPGGGEQVTEQTRKAMQKAHRLKGADGIDMPQTETRDIGSFGTRSVPRQKGESDRTARTKEAVAGLFQPDRKEPYETIRKHPSGDVRVGRYGLSSKQLNHYLSGAGDPPDAAKIDGMVKDGKMPKDFGEKMKNPEFVDKLKDLSTRMANGQDVTKDELKQLLPKDVQESIATVNVDSMKGKLGDKPGNISAAMMTGKASPEISGDDIYNSGARQMSDAGQRMFDIAEKKNNFGKTRAGQIPVEQRKELIETALQKAGLEPTNANIRAVNLIVAKESTWKPDAVNNWDSNARKGTPSKGLMQTIKPTFDRHALPGHKDIMNPLDNMIAGIRYATSRYGSLQNVPGVKAVANGRRYRGY